MTFLLSTTAFAWSQGGGTTFYGDGIKLFKPKLYTDGNVLTYTGTMTVTGTLLADTLKINDSDDSNRLQFIWNEDAAADYNLNFLVGGGSRSLTLNENFSIGNGFDVQITSEDTANDITLDEISVEFESEGTSETIFKISNGVNENRALVFSDDFNVTAGFPFTVEASDGAGTVLLDNKVSLEIEGEGTNARAFKISNAVDEARALIFNDDVTFSAGSTQTYVAEDNNASVTWDNANFEVENANATQRLFKLVVGTDAATTVTAEGTGAVISQDTTTDAQPTFEGVQITDDIAAFDMIIESNGNNGSAPMTADHSLVYDLYNSDRNIDLKGDVIIGAAFTTGDTYTLGITPEDNNSTITLDNATFEVENGNATQRAWKNIHGSDANVNLTVTGDVSLNQNLLTTSAPTFATGVNIGTLNLASGVISDSGGSISFSNENISTTGTLAAANTTINGDLEVYSASSLGSESLAEIDFATHAKWDVVGDWDDSGGNAVYLHNTGSGTLTQTSGNLALALDGDKWYKFAYTVSAVTHTGAMSATITTGIAASAVSLPITAGAQAVYFKTKASPGDFVISVTSDTVADTFTIDDVSLKEAIAGNVKVAGDLVATSITLNSDDTITNTSAEEVTFSNTKQINDGLGTFRDRQTVADDAYINPTLPDATSGWGMVWVENWAAYCRFIVKADGSTIILEGNELCDDADTDGKLGVFDGGANTAVIRNRLGSSQEVRVVYFY